MAESLEALFVTPFATERERALAQELGYHGAMRVAQAEPAYRAHVTAARIEQGAKSFVTPAERRAVCPEYVAPRINVYTEGVPRAGRKLWAYVAVLSLGASSPTRLYALPAVSPAASGWGKSDHVVDEGSLFAVAEGGVVDTAGGPFPVPSWSLLCAVGSGEYALIVPPEDLRTEQSSVAITMYVLHHANGRREHTETLVPWRTALKL